MDAYHHNPTKKRLHMRRAKALRQATGLPMSRTLTLARALERGEVYVLENDPNFEGLITYERRCMDPQCNCKDFRIITGPRGSIETPLWSSSYWEKIDRRKNPYQHNPDEQLRRLERQYAIEPSNELRDKINAIRERIGGFPLLPRVFEHLEGWQAQTKFSDGRIISSATMAHDGWWGVGHVTFMPGDGNMQDLGSHHVNSIYEDGQIIKRFEDLPKPAREEVIEAHTQVVGHFREQGLEGILHQSWRRNPESPLQEAIEELDRSLTGKVEPSAKERYPSTLEEWIDKDGMMIYLSDGGYSRLYLDIEGDYPLIVLGSESLSRTKAKWHSSLHLVRRIQNIIKQEMIDKGWT